MNEKFVVNNDLNIQGTSLAGEIRAYYTELTTLFGKADEGDSYKTVSEWCFEEQDSGAVITLYDYKETSAYSSGYPSVDDFKTGKFAIEYHIGAKSPDTARRFEQFLREKLELLRRPNSIKYITEE